MEAELLDLMTTIRLLSGDAKSTNTIAKLCAEPVSQLSLVPRVLEPNGITCKRF